MGLLFLLSSCVQVRQIGYLPQLNRAFTMDSTDLILLAKFTGVDKKEMQKSRAETIEEALEITLRKVPGGEFLRNVRIHISRPWGLSQKTYFSVSGDVWGKKDGVDYRRFKIGDEVGWRTLFGIREGEIAGYVDEKRVMVETDSDCDWFYLRVKKIKRLTRLYEESGSVDQPVILPVKKPAADTTSRTIPRVTPAQQKPSE